MPRCYMCNMFVIYAPKGFHLQVAIFSLMCCMCILRIFHYGQQEAAQACHGSGPVTFCLYKYIYSDICHVTSNGNSAVALYRHCKTSHMGNNVMLPLNSFQQIPSKRPCHFLVDLQQVSCAVFVQKHTYVQVTQSLHSCTSE